MDIYHFLLFYYKRTAHKTKQKNNRKQYPKVKQPRKIKLVNVNTTVGGHIGPFPLLLGDGHLGP